MAIRGIRNQQDDRPLPPFAPVEAPAPPLRLDELIVDPPDIDLTSTPAAERYSAWADRLRDKRRRDQARIRGDQADGAGGSHWNADTVIGRPGEHEFSTPGLPVPSSEVAARLGVLGLEPGATPEQINLAYRRLAKVHHPDRWAEADEATQRHHSEAMLRINGAYRALSTPQIA